MARFASVGLLLLVFSGGGLRAAEPAIRLGRFDVDATPPVGSPLAYDPCKEIVMPLHCRGVVLLGDEQPIVLCAVDWIGIGNEANVWFRRRLAEAVGTTVERVAVHTVHQHDAPTADLSAERLLAAHGASGVMFNVEHFRRVVRDAAEAARRAAADAQPVTHVGLGEGRVEKVASNRRILGPDGKVAWTRYTSGASQQRNREAPVGVIDPMAKLIVFYHGDEPLAALAYYACHPQSYYRTGGANPDFPGIARAMREQATGVLHVYFTGAGGDVGAGKWNDGSPPYRRILAERLAAGLKRAWDRQRRVAVGPGDLGWRVEQVALPLADHVKPERLEQQLADPATPVERKPAIAKALAWARRCLAGEKIDLQCLVLGPARVLHMPGELLVEYQLAAQQMRPDLFVAVAAYGDYAPGYICPAIAYEQGGYEASERASRVAPGVEGVLMGAMRRLLEADGPDAPSRHGEHGAS